MKTHSYTCSFVAIQTPEELSGIILAVIIISTTLNILFISVLILILIVFVTTRRKSGRVYNALNSHVLIL